MSICQLKFNSKNPSRKRAFESETKTSQLFLNENNIILINFVITVSYAIVMIQVSGFSKLNLISISVLVVISVPTNTAHFFLRISYVCSHFVAKWSLKSYTRHTTWKNVKAYNWSYGRRQKISWQRKREWLLENVTCEFQYYHKKNIHKTVTRGIVNATGVSSH